MPVLISIVLAIKVDVIMCSPRVGRIVKDAGGLSWEVLPRNRDLLLAEGLC